MPSKFDAPCWCVCSLHRRQMKVRLASVRLRVTPLHFRCTHFWHTVQSIELAATSFPHTPQGHATDSDMTPVDVWLNITFVLPASTLTPYDVMLAHHTDSFRSSSILDVVISTRSSAKSSFPDSLSLAFLDTQSMTIARESSLSSCPLTNGHMIPFFFNLSAALKI